MNDKYRNCNGSSPASKRNGRTTSPGPKYVSIAEIESDDTPLVFNPAADATGSIRPLPAGEYHVMLEFLDPRPDRRWVLTSSTYSSQRFRAAQLNVTVQEEKFAGRSFSTGVTTYRVSGHSQAYELVKALGYGHMLRVGPELTSEVNRILNEHMSESPTCIARVEWEAWHPQGDRYRRMWHFPRTAQGEYEWRLEARNGESYFATNVVRGWRAGRLPSERPQGTWA